MFLRFKYKAETIYLNIFQIRELQHYKTLEDMTVTKIYYGNTSDKVYIFQQDPKHPDKEMNQTVERILDILEERLVT